MPADIVLSETELVEELRSLSGWEVRDTWLRRTDKTPGWPHTALIRRKPDMADPSGPLLPWLGFIP